MDERKQKKGRKEEGKRKKEQEGKKRKRREGREKERKRRTEKARGKARGKLETPEFTPSPGLRAFAAPLSIWYRGRRQGWNPTDRSQLHCAPTIPGGGHRRPQFGV